MTEKAKPSKDGATGQSIRGQSIRGKPVAGKSAGAALTTEEAVGFFLRKNPDFLSGFLDDNPEMLPRLRPRDKQQGTDVVDLRHVILERLRDEVTRLTDQQRGIISASRANLTIQNRIHSAVLHLLEARSFQDLIGAITTDLPPMLDLDVAALVIERNGPHDQGRVKAHGVKAVPADFIDAMLEGQEIVLQSGIGGDDTLYGPAGRQVRSQALIRLTVSSQTPPCMLALGSREPDMFQDGMRTDLTAFLARVMERCIRQSLDLPA